MTRAACLAAFALAVALPALAQPPANATAELLRELIRLDTSNPPGHEGLVGDFLESRLKPLGFQVTQVPTPEAGKTHFFARLKGDGSKRPVLLAAHADVVGVEREKWTVDPFGGVVKDGFVYGRGALDFKGGLAVFARAVMQLAENKVPLARDVIFLVEADEEAQPYNTSWLAREHWAEMDAEFALNEGGWIIADEAGTVQYVSISTADKQSVPVLVTARGTSTHSSMPRPDSAIFALGKALAKLASYETPVQFTAESRQFFETLAKTSPEPQARLFRDLLGNDPAAANRADREISRDPLLHALLRNTIAPVLIGGGFRSNVIPGSATATLNVRLIPGTDANVFAKELARVIGDPNVEVTPQSPPSGLVASAPSPVDNELYKALAKNAAQVFSGAEVTPYLFQAGTDAGAWRSRGVPVYGIYPYPITAEELTRMHGNDERIGVAALEQGTRVIYQTLVDVAARR